jgi:hypothetical protein
MLEPMQRTYIEEVVFVDDFFRVSENELPAPLENRKFLRAFFGVAAARLGWRVREACAQSQGGTIPVAQIMDALDLPCSPQGWAAACAADLRQAAAHLATLDLAPTTLVIGWGLPPSIMQYVDRQGAAFIDVEIHSIRFTRDLHLAVRTNDPGIHRELERLSIDEEVFWSAAAGLRGLFARRGQSFVVNPECRVGVFVGQTEVDLALVEGGQLKRPVDFAPQIAEWAKQVDLLAICPHPAQAKSEQLNALLERIPNAAVVTSNTYSLLCADNLAFVCGASSGVLKEARYLGCSDIRQLISDDRNAPDYLPATCSPWIPVRLDVATVDSLQAFALARQGSAQPPAAQLSARREPAFPDEMLNDIFIYRWGFDRAANGLPLLPELTLEQPLSLAAGAPGAAHASFGRGWHSPEGWGVWSAGGRSWLVVAPGAFEAGSGEDFELSLHGYSYAPASFAPPDVSIRVNGRTCELRFDADGAQRWAVDLSAEAIRNRLLVIAMEVRGAMRPRDVGENDDTRLLGLALQSVTLRRRLI